MQNTKQQVKTHGLGGGKVVLHCMGWLCHFAAMHAKLGEISWFEMGFLFWMKAKPKGIALALVKHGNGCKKE